MVPIASTKPIAAVTSALRWSKSRQMSFTIVGQCWRSRGVHRSIEPLPQQAPSVMNDPAISKFVFVPASLVDKI